MVLSLVERQTSALVASDRLFGRESDSGSEVVGSLEEGQTAAPFNKSYDSGHLETVEYVEY